MPTYDYECRACAHIFEALQTMSEPKLTKCPRCGKDQLARLMGSGSGVIFKGSGFYETDYKKKEAPKSEKKDSSPAPACASCPMKDSGGCSS
ncbi:MAG: zinc ribbon domain-containing protein [Candidatus Omnitrophica bacterium]|nr:zinc ribbon domain-containing protein [Candidatus Omnitrophota bacterium]